MNKNLELAQDRFIERIGNMCSKFGLNHFIAQLYALLYLNNEPLSLDDLTQRLKVSKGNVSINIRELERWGAVRKIWIKGSRKDFYQAESDVKKVFLSKVKYGIQKRISEVSGILEEFNNTVSSASAKLTPEERKIIKGYKDRLKKIEELKSLASNALRLAEKFL